MADELSRFAEKRGGDDELVRRILAGEGPRERAAALIAGTTLFEVDARKKLAAAGTEGIAASKDPLVQPHENSRTRGSRALRERTEELDERERQAYAKLTDVKFKLEGESTYPDATFTLRLAFGQVKGYQEDGQQIPSIQRWVERLTIKTS